MTTRSSNVRDTSDGPSKVKSQQAGSVQDLKIMRVMVDPKSGCLLGRNPESCRPPNNSLIGSPISKEHWQPTQFRIAQINPFQGLTIYVEAS